MIHNTPYNWSFFLNPVLSSARMRDFKEFLQNERKSKSIYPRSENVFKAFELCPYHDTKVVIMGQDPYHTPGTAHGLCFSSLQQETPPSLRVIFTEIYRDLNLQYDYNVTMEEVFPSNDLTKWGRSGFLLLNSVLTVEEGKANAHRGMGWEGVAEAAIEALNQLEKPIIFLLWGKEAQKYKSLVKGNNMVLEAGHPVTELYNNGGGSFYGCKHFSIIRDILPEIHLEDNRIVIDMTDFFKKTKAINYIKELHPQYAKEAEEYIRQYLTIPIWLNPHHRLLYHREFLNILSTSNKPL